MATFTIDDLTTPATTEEIKVAIYNSLAASGVTTTNWRPGAVVRTMIAAVALVLAALTSLIAEIAKGGYLDKASGAWLTLLAKYVYGRDRIGATFAAGIVTLTNNSLSTYTFTDPGDLTLKNSSSGATYTNVAGFTLNPSSTVSNQVFVCQQAGEFGTSFAGEIDAIESPALNGVVVSNPAALIGYDEEDDETLRTACLERLGALSPMGPPDAYAYAAKNAVRSDGSRVGVTRVRLENSGDGHIVVYCAKDTATVTGAIGDTSTDLGAVDDAIQRNAAPQCITATTLGASPVPISIVYQLYLYDTTSATNDQIFTAINATFVNLLATIPIGGTIIPGNSGRVYLDTIKSALMNTTINGVRIPIFHLTTNVDNSPNPFPLNINEFPTAGILFCDVIQRLPQNGSII